MNFGAAAENYAKHRLGFPESFFKKVPLKGIVLDLGAGTGTLTRGYCAQGCFVCAVDVSAEMLAQIHSPCVKIVARAEECSFADDTFNHVVVGQAWHWFGSESVAIDCRRILKRGGQLVIASLDYRLAPGNIAERTEEIILRHNPTWPLVGFKDYSHERIQQLERHGFVDVHAHEYDENIAYTKDGWRGRLQACNGVMAMPSAEQRTQFDTELEQLLKSETEPLSITHRIAWVVGIKPEANNSNQLAID